HVTAHRGRWCPDFFAHSLKQRPSCCASAPRRGAEKCSESVFMRQRSLRSSDSCPTAVCPISIRRHDGVLPLPALTPISHPEMLQRRGFFFALLAECVPVGYGFVDNASAQKEKRSRTASLRSQRAPTPLRPPASSV